MNRLKQTIEGMERPNFPFKPQKEFYHKLGIGRKRFWQIMRNEAQPNITEMESIAKYFGIDKTDLLTNSQESK